MGISVNGNDIEFDGTVKVINGFNPDTGVAYLILTPKGGTGAIPFLAQGLPGLPPVFDNITVEEVDPGDPLPSPNPVRTLVSAGGPGVASHWNLKFYIHSGATGSTGTYSISGAADLASTPALGSGTNTYQLIYRNSDNLWVPQAQKVGNQYVPATLSNTAYDATPNRVIGSVSIAAQPFDWRPRVFASTIVTGSSDTRVDLVARLDDPASGDVVGYSKGIAGAAPPPMVLIPAAPPGSALPGSYAKVTAGNAATVYLRAEQKAASSNPWSTPGYPGTTYWVEIEPLL